jgi:hypothetical protein
LVAEARQRLAGARDPIARAAELRAAREGVEVDASRDGVEVDARGDDMQPGPDRARSPRGRRHSQQID